MSQWGPIRNLSATRYCLLTLTLLQCFWAHWSVKQRGGFVQCLSGSKGLWSIGIFKGSGPFDLQPVEEYSPRQDTLTAWPVANPVLTCASLFLDDEVAGVASPVLWRNSTGAITMFYTLQYRGWGRDAVGAATSVDGGRSFQYAQPVLQEPWALGTPSLFQHAGQVYMLVPSLGKEVTWLYRATSFPHSWEREAEALPFPVSAVHVFQHVDRWWLFAHRRDAARGLDLHWAHSPLGPWERHADAPLPAPLGGRPFLHEGRLLRPLHAAEGPTVAEVTVLSGEAYQEAPPRLLLAGAAPARPSAWDARGRWRADVLPPDAAGGEWLAAADGRSGRGAEPLLALRWALQLGAPWLLALALPLAARSGSAAGPLTWLAARRPAAPGLPAWLRAARLAGAHHKKSSVDLGRPRPGEGPGPALAGATFLPRLVTPIKPSGLVERHHSTRGPDWTCELGGTPAAPEAGAGAGDGARGAGAPPPRRTPPPCPPCGVRSPTAPPWGLRSPAGPPRLGRARAGPWPRLRRLALGLALGTLGAAALAAGLYVGPLLERAAPVPVDGQLSRFTVLVMTYAARRPMLAGFVVHYAACPSVQEVVVVWNKGPLPEPGVDYDDRAVPVRVRAEAANSLNNRFRVDPALRTRAVLSIDDDIRLTCADVEAGFAAWRRAPETMHGFFPRRMAGEPLTFHGERDTIEAGAYNVILTGAAFLDSATAFPAYWADAVAPARATVDRLFNGEDVLMNFVLANRTAALQRGASNAAPVRYISFLRPKRRVDISKLSPVGISHNFAKFLDATQTYLRTFQEVFGTNPLVLQEFDWTATPRPFCGSKTLGCVYL
ncbi:hypothetical protein ACKKBF_B37215 [Auxenochlorella protothecoides x Auxenochlorella symbiontica]